MDKLRLHYETELSKLHHASQSFARQHPEIASRIQLGTDREIERLMQSIALLNASTASRIDDQHADLTSALLHGHPALRPFPSCAIAQVDYGNARPNAISNEACIPRGTMFKAAVNTACKFRTAYDIHITPLTVAEARLAAIDVPSVMRLPSHASTSLRLTINSTASNQPISGSHPLRVYVQGATQQASAIMDALLMRCLCVCLQAGERWTLLPHAPFHQAGLSEEESLLPAATCHGLLTEYFCFPEKFSFFDIDLPAITALAPNGSSVTLHVILPAVQEMLRSVTRDNFLLGCSPIINLFPHRASPIKLDATATEYSITPDQLPGAEIYSIDGVRLLSRADASSEFKRFEACGSGETFWSTGGEEGSGDVLSLTDRHRSPLGLKTGALSVQLTCTNGDLPQSLSIGCQTSDLITEVNTAGLPTKLLHPPTPTQHPAASTDHWSLISRGSDLPGLDALVEFLELHAAPDSTASQHLLQGLLGLRYQSSSKWIRTRHVHGVDAHLSIDEKAFAERSIHTFAAVLKTYFAILTPANSYVQLLIESDGRELLRCEPMAGCKPLI